jgi:hypothetical protein
MWKKPIETDRKPTPISKNNEWSSVGLFDLQLDNHSAPLVNRICAGQEGYDPPT